MPFITQDRRKLIDESGLGLESLPEIQPGDLCYVHYKRIVDQWKANPRWTTAHEIYRNLYFDGKSLGNDDSIARDLAWQCFFYFYVLPYEEQKRKANGDI